MGSAQADPAAKSSFPVWLIVVLAIGGFGFLGCAGLFVAVWSYRDSANETVVTRPPPYTSPRTPPRVRPVPRTNNNNIPSQPQPIRPTPSPAIRPSVPNSIPSSRVPAATTSSIAFWDAKADPLPAEFSLTEVGPLAIPLESTSSDGVVYPDNGNRFIAVEIELGGNDGMQVWDLQERRPAGKFVEDPLSKASFTRFSLSSDGKYIAAVAFGGTAPTSGKGLIYVWDMDSGQKIHELEMPVQWTSIRPVKITVDNKLIGGISHGNTDHNIRVFDLATGNLEKKLAAAGRVEGAEVSPGGKYLATYDDGLRIYEIESGKNVAQTSYDDDYNCKVISFSPNGKEILTIVDKYNETRFVVYDVDQGKLTATISKSVGFSSLIQTRQDRETVEWLDGGAAWLVGGAQAFSSSSGAKVWSIPKEFDTSVKRLVLPGNQIVVADTRTRDDKLITFNMGDNLSEVASVIDAGGEAVDTLLPPIKQFAKQQVTARSIGQSDGWPAGFRLATPSQSPGPLSSPMNLGPGRISQAYVAAEAPIVVMSRGLSRVIQNTLKEKTVFIDSFDLNSGEKLNRLEIPKPAELFDLSPSGNVMLTRMGGEMSRLDLWRPRTGEHVIGFRPYLHNTVRPKISFGSGKQATPRYVDWARLVDDQHVLTYSSGSKTIDLWELPSLRLVYSLKSESRMRVLTPLRDYLIVENSGQLAFIDTKQGNLAATLDYVGNRVGIGNANSSKASNVSFSPDHTKMAWVMQGTGYLSIWDMSTGLRSFEGSGGRHFSHVTFLSDRYLLSGAGSTTSLFDLQREVCVWNYICPNMEYIDWTPAGQVAVLPDNRQDFFLATIELPDPGAIEAIEAQVSSDPANVILGPGSSIALDISISVADATKVREALTKLFTSRGVRVETGAPLKLVARTTSGKSESVSYGKGMAFGFGSRGKPEFTISIPSTNCTLHLVDATGKKLYSLSRKASGYTPSYVRTTDGKDPATELRRMATENHKNSVSGFFSNPQIPIILRDGPVHGSTQAPIAGVATTRLDGLINVPIADPAALAAAQAKLRSGTSGTTADTVAQALIDEYVSLLSSDGELLKKRMGWLPGSKRPTVGIRWGVGVEFKTEEGRSSPTIRSDRDFDRNTGEAGAALVKALNDRTAAGKFGQWPAAAHASFGKLTPLYSGSREAILQLAKDQRLNAVAIIEVNSKDRNDKIMRIRVFHIDGIQEMVVPKSLSKTFSPGKGDALVS